MSDAVIIEFTPSHFIKVAEETISIFIKQAVVQHWDDQHITAKSRILADMLLNSINADGLTHIDAARMLLEKLKDEDLSGLDDRDRADIESSLAHARAVVNEADRVK